MKLSQFWFRWSRGVMVMLVTLGFYGWTPALVSAAMEYNEKIPFVDDFDACSGERISVDGVQHIVGRFTKDGNGKLHFGFTRDTIGTGIGQISGDKYVLTDAVARSSLEIVPGQSQTFLEQYHSRLIRQGEAFAADDTLIHFLSKITLNADGEVTASIEIQKVECK
jgi:hypothetical protein